MSVSTLSRTLPLELVRLQQEIEAYARTLGLDFFQTIFEVLDYDEMNQVAAYGGFPTRYPHWRFGMEYERIAKGYGYGLSKIYEMVINNDPCYAYLLRSNPLVDQKLVMAHVYGHCDFFKNNLWFRHTNRQMLDEMANHGTRFRQYMDRYGLETVEGFLDACLSLDDLIDPHSVAIKRHDDPPTPTWDDTDRDEPTVQKLPSKSYLDSYINPPEFIAAEQAKLAAAKAERQRTEQGQIVLPSGGERDLLLFLLEQAPLEKWQADVLAMIREEAYYFAPQGQTKIMNEGWASYWHAKILTERALTDAELVDYADHHSGTMGMRPGQVNPYKLGLELWRDIEERWDKGRHGSAYEQCEDAKQRRLWDTHQAGRGREKIFEVRRFYNDVDFIGEFLTLDFCREHKLFTYQHNAQADYWEIASREFEAIKQKLLFSLTNHGRPFIYVTDANANNRGELYLTHRHEGMNLRLDYAQDVMVNLYRLWTRPIHVETVIEGIRTVISYDGHDHKSSQKKAG